MSPPSTDNFGDKGMDKEGDSVTLVKDPSLGTNIKLLPKE